jgi:taurine dioxygenase
MAQPTLKVTPYSAALGAVISGVDLSQPLDDTDFKTIRQAFHDHGVIFFRDQQITPEQHLAFARRWAPIDVNRFFKAAPGYPEIAEVRKEPEQKTNIGGGWHTDHSYDEAPAMGSILLARELPEEGGDTLFANMYRAFETLSPGLQRTLEGMRAVHGSAHIFGKGGVNDKNPEGASRYENHDKVGADVVHPVVIKHPLSGRKALYVNRAFTLRFDGWTAEDSKPLLDYLYQHAARPEFTCRFHWREGSVAFWDNRATWHYAANDYQGERRLMHRITVAGCALQAATA